MNTNKTQRTRPTGLIAQPGMFFPHGGAIMNTGAQQIEEIIQ
ncbi:MAG: hypothetical protein ACYS8I_12280 [Planctomycetota bacterium]|jgi:hypothetical protein